MAGGGATSSRSATSTLARSSAATGAAAARVSPLHAARRVRGARRLVAPPRRRTLHTDVSVDERLTASGSTAPRTFRSGMERGAYRARMFWRRRSLPLASSLTLQISPFPLDQPVSDQGSEHTCLTDVGLAHLARCYRGPEKLSLVWCSVISSTGLVRIAENCKKLTSLDLQACFIGDSRLKAIGEGCKLLRKLNLRFLEGITDQGLIGLGENYGQSLVSLAIVNYQWLADASLHAVGSHSFGEPDLVQSVGIISIAQGCRLVITLKLQCLGAGVDALDAVGSFCLLLEILSLNNFKGFIDRY